MPVPNPTPLELAQAGAAIVGVYRRDTELVRVSRDTRRFDLMLFAAALVMVLAMLATGLVVAATSKPPQSAAVFAGCAALLTLIVFAGAIARSLNAGLQGLGYTPDELVRLIGYVEVGWSGDSRTTPLGRRAVSAYLVWTESPTESGSPSDPVSRHRPLEGS